MISAISPEFLLLIAVVVIYLFDCVVLLYVNEAVVQHRGLAWRVGFGSRQTWIAGRRLHLMNPFTPFDVVYRTTWQVCEHLPGASEADQAKLRCAEKAGELESLLPLLKPAAVVTLLVLPVAIVLWGSLGFLIGIALTWLFVIALLVRFFLLRARLGLTGPEFAMMAFECIACPPCAVNLLRKLSLRFQPGLDLLAFIPLVGESKATALAIAHVGADVDARLLWMDEGTVEHERTLRYRELLREECRRLSHSEVQSR